MFVFYVRCHTLRASEGLDLLILLRILSLLLVVVVFFVERPVSPALVTGSFWQHSTGFLCKRVCQMKMKQIADYGGTCN